LSSSSIAGIAGLLGSNLATAVPVVTPIRHA
jgi:hypothetical protein